MNIATAAGFVVLAVASTPAAIQFMDPPASIDIAAVTVEQPSSLAPNRFGEVPRTASAGCEPTIEVTQIDAKSVMLSIAVCPPTVADADR